MKEDMVFPDKRQLKKEVKKLESDHIPTLNEIESENSRLLEKENAFRKKFLKK